jgi:hypothetical protein
MSWEVRFKGGPHDGEVKHYEGYVPNVLRVHVPQACFPLDWRPPPPDEQVAPTAVQHIAAYRLRLWREGYREWYVATYVETK